MGPGPLLGRREGAARPLRRARLGPGGAARQPLLRGGRAWVVLHAPRGRVRDRGPLGVTAARQARQAGLGRAAYRRSDLLRGARLSPPLRRPGPRRRRGVATAGGTRV